MTTYKSPLIDNEVYPRGPHTGVQVMTLAMTFSGSASVSTGDIVQIFPVSEGMTVHSIQWAGNWAATAASAGHTVEIGDAGDPNRFVTSASASATLTTLQVSDVAAGIGYTYTADDTIDVAIGTITASSGTSTGTMTFVMWYSTGGGDR